MFGFTRPSMLVAAGLAVGCQPDPHAVVIVSAPAAVQARATTLRIVADGAPGAEHVVDGWPVTAVVSGRAAGPRQLELTAYALGTRLATVRLAVELGVPPPTVSATLVGLCRVILADGERCSAADEAWRTCVDGECVDGCLADTADPTDLDKDGIRDACDDCVDPDDDGICGAADRCPGRPDGAADTDGDGVPDACDNCTLVPNPSVLVDGMLKQRDTDGDGFGNACDADVVAPEGGRVVDIADLLVVRCAVHGGTARAVFDFDGNGAVDLADVGFVLNALGTVPGPSGLVATASADRDGDGAPDAVDRCPAAFDPDQSDIDGDGLNDACDNCVTRANGPLSSENDLPSQADGDGDRVGDVCDADFDQDGLTDMEDFEAFSDCFGATVTDRPECAPFDLLTDGVVGIPDFGRIQQLLDAPPGPSAFSLIFFDPDGDGIPVWRDEFPTVCDTGPDADGDGIADRNDNCPLVVNASQLDVDRDDIGDACDTCRFIPNPQQLATDADGDGVTDDCDLCPAMADGEQPDRDGDLVGDRCDNCPGALNPTQTDGDGDGIGNTCDNCPTVPNPAQDDADGDGIGDACPPM